MAPRRPRRLLLLLFLVGPRAQEVVELGSENWETRMKGTKIAVVEFYAPWCVHSARFRSEYRGMTAENVMFGRVDGTVETGLAKRYDVTGYPEVLLFRNDVVTHYDGAYDHDALKTWIDRKIQLVTVLSNWTDAREFWDDEQVRVLGLGENNVFQATLEAAALELDNDDVVFGFTRNPNLIEGGQKLGVYVRSPHVEDDSPFLEGDPPTAEAIAEFVRARASPAVTTYPTALGHGGIHVLLFLDVDMDVDVIDRAFEQVAIQRRHLATHVVVPASEQRLLEHFDIDVTELPVLLAVDLRHQENRPTRTYRYEPRRYGIDLRRHDHDVAPAILAFEDAVVAGALPPYLRSEDPSFVGTKDFRSTTARGGVVHLTGTSFSTIVTASRQDPTETIDFLITFFAPWCVHCKAFAAVFEDLALDFRNVDAIVLAKIDATKNEIPINDLTIDAFPTLVFFPADPNRPYVIYNGPRDRSHITAFLQHHGTAAFDLGASPSSDPSSRSNVVCDVEECIDFIPAKTGGA